LKDVTIFEKRREGAETVGEREREREREKHKCKKEKDRGKENKRMTKS
jgi:hypothetical protein